MGHLEFTPEIPFALWLALLFCALALLSLLALRRRGRLGKRRWCLVMSLWGLAVGGILVVLLNPTWVKRIPPPEGKPVLTVLIDQSAGMATQDVKLASGNAAGADKLESRFAKACQAAQTISSKLNEKYDVRLRTFAEGSQTVTPEQLSSLQPDGSETNIAVAMREALLQDQEQGQAVLLLSDGQHNATGGVAPLWGAAEQLRAMAVPIYNTPLGSQEVVNDIAISVDNPQELALVDGKILVGVTVVRRGLRQLQKTEVALKLDNEVIEKKEAIFADDGRATVAFTIEAKKAGLFRYLATVEHYPEEITAENNSSALLLRVVDHPVRVLLLEGKPYWDTKFLTHTLTSDASVELTSLVRIKEDRYLARQIRRNVHRDGKEENVKNTGQEDWKIYNSADAFFAEHNFDEFLVVILGRSVDPFLTDERLAQLKKWIAQGEGSLVCSRGQPTSRVGIQLAEILPVHWSVGRKRDYNVSLTNSGKAAPWLRAIGAAATAQKTEGETAKKPEAKKPDDAATTEPRTVVLQQGDDPFAGLPPLQSSLVPDRPSPLTTILAEREEGTVPVISWQPYGIGRVVVVEGAGMWRWAFLSPDAKQKESNVHSQLWQSLLRRLVSNVTLLPNQQAALASDQLTYRPGEVVRATLLMRPSEAEENEQPVLLLKNLDKATSEEDADEPRLEAIPQGDAPGRYRINVGKLPVGRYQLTLVQAENQDGEAKEGEPSEPVATWFEVRSDLRELLDIESQPNLLARLSDLTGGETVGADDLATLDQKIEQHLRRLHPERVERKRAWDQAWVLLLLLIGFATVWTLRRRSGLV